MCATNSTNSLLAHSLGTSVDGSLGSPLVCSFVFLLLASLASRLALDRSAVMLLRPLALICEVVGSMEASFHGFLACVSSSRVNDNFPFV
ncbi:hypothetical protein Hanom_Chr07g00638421 [Helianthus anomalus]